MVYFTRCGAGGGAGTTQQTGDENMKARCTFAGTAIASALACTGLADDPASVKDALSGTRVVQGKPLYTEVNDSAMNRIIVADRAVDREWLEAAKDPAAFKARQESVRAAWVEAIGGFPAERCDLDVKTTGVAERDGYRIEKTLFQSRPGHHVTATVFVPTDTRFKAPYPAVLVPCGHSYNGKMVPDYQRPGVIGAKNGFVVMVYDPIDQGERPQNRKVRKPMTCNGHNRTGHRAALVGWNTAQFRIWDGMRALDALCARPDVDSKRLAVTGHSGGGTTSSYIMAMDKRIAAAAPSGFIASIRCTNWDVGASDAEQQFYGQLKFGMNHLALFMLAADRCAALHLATHADFFPFIGAYETAECAAAAYKSIGREGCFQLIDSSGPHLWPESSKQAEFLWFRKHLKGEDVWRGYDCASFQKYNLGFSFDDPNVDVGLAREKNNIVTPTGNVLDLPGERNVYDIIRDEARRLEGARRPVTPDMVRAAAGIRRSGFRAEAYNRQDRELANGKSAAVTLLTDDGIALQMFTFQPASPKGGQRPVMIVSDEINSVSHAARVEELLAEGRSAVVFEARGWGLTGRYFRHHRGEGGGSATKYYGIPTMDEMVTMKYYHLGENMVAHRAEDMLAAADAAREILGYDGAFDLEAYGRACIPAAHALFVGEGRFADMKTVKPTWSWRQMIDDENLFTRFADVVHGAYRLYDWADLPVWSAQTR